MVEYVPIRTFVSTEHREVDLNELKSALEYAFSEQGLDAHVRTVKKVRGPYEDVFVVYADMAGTEGSPLFVSGTDIAMLIIALGLVFGIAVVAYYAINQLRNRVPELNPYEDLKTLIYDLVDHLPHDSVEAMVDYLEKNHPEWYPGKSFCDVCGMVFESREKMMAHRLACPDIEPISPVGPGIIPKLGMWAPGYFVTKIMETIKGLLGR